MELKLKDKISYSLGDFSYTIVYAFLNAFILTYFTDVAKIPAVTAGAIVLIANIFDAVNDPIIGFLADRTRSKHGRYRPWMMIAIVPAAILLVLCFFVPDMKIGTKVIYSYVIYLAWTVAKTCVQIPYSALESTLTGDSTQRISIGAVRDWMSNIGGLFVSLVAVKIVASYGESNVTGYRIAALVIAGCSVVGYYISVLTSKEKYYADEAERIEISSFADKTDIASEKFDFDECEAAVNQNQDNEKNWGTIKNTNKKGVSILSSLAAIFTSGYAIAIIGFVFMGQIAMGIRMSLGTYYCIYFLEDSSLSVMSVTMALTYAIPILGIPFIPKLIRKFGRRKVMITGALLNVLTGAVTLLAERNYFVANLSGFCMGVSMCFVMSVVWGAIPDTADYIFSKKGINVTGFLMAFISVGCAAGTGVCGFISSCILDFVGYVSTAVAQPASVGTGIYWAFGGAPVIFGLLMVAFAAMFRLKTD